MKILAASILVALVACDTNPVPPIHQAIVCTSPVKAEALDCDPAIRSTMFERWEHDAANAPGSSFAIWALDDRGTPTLWAEAVIPERWGSNVLRARGRFLTEARDSVASTARRHASPMLELTRKEREERLIAVAPVGLAELDLGAAAAPAHLVLLCDRSDSTLGVSCGDEALTSALDTWLARGAVTPGSSLEVWIPGNRRDTATRVLAFETHPASRAERAVALLGVRRALPGIVNASRGKPGSALVEALDVATEPLAVRRGKKLVFIASDLRQASAGTFNFERAAPSPEFFMARLEERRLEADLHGVEVQICGVHHRVDGRRGVRFDAKLAERVMAAWMAALHDFGAASVDRRSACVSRLAEPSRQVRLAESSASPATRAAESR